MGAPTNNKNALRTGSTMRLQLGQLPKELARPNRQARHYRCALESLVVEQHGTITATAAHHIQAAATCELTRLVRLYLIRRQGEALDVKSWNILLTGIERSVSDRNKAVAALKLDAPPDPQADIIAALYGPSSDDEPSAFDGPADEPSNRENASQTTPQDFQQDEVA
jgi:hypothetical protein